MKYSIKMENPELYEFVLSFLAFTEKKNHATLELGTEWIRSLTEELSPDFFVKIAASRKLFSGFPLVVVSKSPAQRPREFIKWLQDLSWSELYEMLFLFTDNTPLTNPQDIKEWQELTCDMLNSWYELYFSKVEEEIMVHLTKESASIKLDRDPQEIVEVLSNGIRLDLLTELRLVRLVPQYHFRPYNMYDIGESEFILCYPSRVEASADEPPLELVRLTKALADQSRLQILKILSQGSHTFTEITEKMSIAKSTVHHHLVTLRTAGLVIVYLSPNRNDLFSLREEAVGGVSEQLWRYLKEGTQ